MASWWCPQDLGTIYRPDTKWGLDSVSQVLLPVLTLNFVECFGNEKGITSITSSWMSRDFCSIYRPETKMGQGLIRASVIQLFSVNVNIMLLL